jgi:DNA excision repair protein ERCC-4
VGFIKAFTEDAESLVSGFSKVERILKNLFLKKVFLW